MGGWQEGWVRCLRGNWSSCCVWGYLIQSKCHKNNPHKPSACQIFDQAQLRQPKINSEVCDAFVDRTGRRGEANKESRKRGVWKRRGRSRCRVREGETECVWIEVERKQTWRYLLSVCILMRHCRDPASQASQWSRSPEITRTMTKQAASDYPLRHLSRPALCPRPGPIWRPIAIKPTSRLFHPWSARVGGGLNTWIPMGGCVRRQRLWWCNKTEFLASPSVSPLPPVSPLSCVGEGDDRKGIRDRGGDHCFHWGFKPPITDQPPLRNPQTIPLLPPSPPLNKLCR